MKWIKLVSWCVLSVVAHGSLTLASAGVGSPPVDSTERARALYKSQCLLCHGAGGEADGPGAYLLFPPARDFTGGRFKLASTANGVPSNDDLIATLRRGIPGTSMPSWDWMPEEDLQVLADHVRSLAIAGIADDLRREGAGTEEECLTQAQNRMMAGKPVEVGKPVEPSQENLELGRQSYLNNCASCHGGDGRGMPQTLRRNEDGVMNWARDFTSGVLKGGATHRELSTRILVGMHGTAMPAAALEEPERAALVAYVQSLIPPESVDRLVQRRARIQAGNRSEHPIGDPAEIDWSQSQEHTMALAPLWWQEGAILQARVAAVHDDVTLAIRVRWEDPVPDAPVSLDYPLMAPAYADAVAIQMTPGMDPPFYGMSRGAIPTNIWHYRTVDVPDTEDLIAFLRQLPHRLGDWFDYSTLEGVPLYQLASGKLHVEGEAVSVTPAGMKVLGDQPSLPTPIRAVPSWKEGMWEVVFSRNMEPSHERELPLRAGTRVSISFAIWNGGIRDLRGQKSITIWHELTIER